MESSIHSGATITVPSDVILQELGDEIVLANLDTGVYFTLNEIAARAWEVLTTTEKADAVVPALLEEYEVDEPTLRADIDQLLGQLQEHGLMQLSHA